MSRELSCTGERGEEENEEEKTCWCNKFNYSLFSSQHNTSIVHENVLGGGEVECEVDRGSKILSLNMYRTAAIAGATPCAEPLWIYIWQFILPSSCHVELHVLTCIVVSLICCVVIWLGFFQPLVIPRSRK